MSEAASREMPRYKCHKEVWALKIKRIVLDMGASPQTVSIEFDDEGYAPITAPAGIGGSRFPKAGDYYVKYADGYVSISPAKAFEEGYARI